MICRLTILLTVFIAIIPSITIWNSFGAMLHTVSKVAKSEVFIPTNNYLQTQIENNTSRNLTQETDLEFFDPVSAREEQVKAFLILQSELEANVINSELESNLTSDLDDSESSLKQDDIIGVTSPLGKIDPLIDSVERPKDINESLMLDRFFIKGWASITYPLKIIYLLLFFVLHASVFVFLLALVQRLFRYKLFDLLDSRFLRFHSYIFDWSINSAPILGLTGTIISLGIMAKEKIGNEGSIAAFETAFLANFSIAIETTVYGALIYFCNYLLFVIFQFVSQEKTK